MWGVHVSVYYILTTCTDTDGWMDGWIRLCCPHNPHVCAEDVVEVDEVECPCVHVLITAGCCH